MYCEDSIEKPLMPKAGFIELLKTATGGMFSYKDTLYKQTDGVTMGNPLAPTLAIFLLGHLETEMWNKINGYTPPSSNGTCPALYSVHTLCG